MVFVIIALSVFVFLLVRRTRKKDVVEKIKADEEAASFIQEGFRNPSPAVRQSSQLRKYSLQRPLSNNIPEYSSTEDQGPSP